jgi:hypothetical protein
VRRIVARTEEGDRQMGTSGKAGHVLDSGAGRHRLTTDEELSQTLAEAAVEIDRLCDEHGLTPELLETRQAIEAATAALGDFVDGERELPDE